jgi:hypothetical protein
LIFRPAIFLPILLLLAAGASRCYVDARLPNPDEGALLTAAAKILRGYVFYQNLDAYPFPGAHYLLAGAMRLFGEHLAVARWLAAGFYCAIVASLYGAALQLMERRWAAIFGLCLLSFKFLAWPAFSVYLYSDIAFAGACFAIAMLVGHGFQGASPRLLLAGVGVGVALACKQNLGIYLGAASTAALLFPRLAMGIQAASLRRRLGEVGVLLLGVMAAMSPLIGYFAAQGLLGRMLHSGLIRPLTRYLPTSAIAFSPPLAWWRFGEIQGDAAGTYFVGLYWHLLQQHQLPGLDAYPFYWAAGEIVSRLVYTSIPVAFAWILARRFGSRAKMDERTAKIALLAWLAFAVFASAMPRADAAHVYAVYPVVVLLLFSLCARPRSEPRASLRFWAAGSGVALLLVTCLALNASYQARLSHRVSLNRAEVWVDPDDAWIGPLVEYVSQHVPRGEHIFVYGHEAHLYFLTGRFYPWPYSQLYPGQEGGKDGAELKSFLRRVPPKLVLRGLLVWPGIPVLEEYAPLLDHYVRWNFEIDRSFFVDHPAPVGKPPPEWVISVMRPASNPIPWP